MTNTRRRVAIRPVAQTAGQEPSTTTWTVRPSLPLSRSRKSRGRGGSTEGVAIMKRTRPRVDTAESTSAAGTTPSANASA